MISKKYKWVLLVGLVAVLGVISIVYAALSTTLTLNETASLKPWNIRFENIGNTTSSGEGISAGTVTKLSTNGPNDTLRISGLQFRDYGQYVIYKFDIRNYGTVTAKLKSYSVTVKNSDNTDNNDIVADLRAYGTSDSYILNSSNPTTYNGISITLIANEIFSDYFYLKIRYKHYSPTTNNSNYTTNTLPNATFTVTLNPVWEEVT